MRRLIIIVTFILLLVGCSINNIEKQQENTIKDVEEKKNIENKEKFLNEEDQKAEEYLVIPRIQPKTDEDNDGIFDLDDIVQGARIEAQNKPIYKSKYYSGGYPPDNEGVCTDVIWRAYKNAGFNLKDMVDADIKNNLSSYPIDVPDPNIDFRRVKNLIVFFENHGSKLTCELIPGDKDNLVKWQGGDIVIFKQPEHIGILSLKRRKDGVPYLIHNAGPYTKEADHLLYWMDNIIGHYRFPYE